MKQMLKIVGVILLAFLVLLFFASLLTVFKAPTYHLWVLAIAVSEFPLIFIGLTGLLLIGCFWVEKFQSASILIGVLALVLFLSPVARAYLVASTLKQNFNTAFGPGSTIINGDNTQPVFSFIKLFKGAGKQFAYQTITYSEAHKLTLDYYPAQVGGKKPCVVVVHGGSWSSGDSQQLPELNSYLATDGYNVASINYRLAPQYKAPLAIEDVDQALAYLRKNADKLNIDTNNFVLLGRSAGAQIALLSAYNRPQNGLKGIVNFYGPADMVWGYSKPASKLVMDSRGVMERYLGGTYNAVPNKYFASSPIEFVNKQTVPTLIIHGENDVLVSPIHSHKLDAKLTENGVKHYYLNLPWATHGFDYNINGPGGQLSTYVVERFVNTVCK
ncbi:alpha/beta hydrolase [Mucilaginibacter sp. RB4R14]|uniref:alpha/beta hydrolase n=1 Tax=Mucilaginibacter aurantiaciroseus TaxID=2949308 RepID=UPI002090D3FA|nr:alpha/beta hydrolase [Mucilaginibacter aurantiaciroseus]MCO5936952.1 alpha/beta hydrolase [Mucilaginibacter aurantiaciroseus]